MMFRSREKKPCVESESSEWAKNCVNPDCVDWRRLGGWGETVVGVVAAAGEAAAEDTAEVAPSECPPLERPESIRSLSAWSREEEREEEEDDEGEEEAAEADCRRAATGVAREEGWVSGEEGTRS